MSIELPPSKYGAGTTYTGHNEIVVSPEQSPVPAHITHAVGARAAEGVVAPPRIWRGEGPQQPSVQVEATYAAASDVRPGNSYDGAASRQMALDHAEALNIQSAARDAGKSVDRWKADRHRAAR